MSSTLTPEVEELIGLYAMALAAVYLGGTPEEFRAISQILSELPPTLELRVTLMAMRLMRGDPDQ